MSIEIAMSLAGFLYLFILVLYLVAMPVFGYVVEIGDYDSDAELQKIIKNPKKSGKFEKGDILVTPMTRPVYMPFIEKASAIITDAGGVLCHAAIIARELKKVCIVGTGNATKVLKDGDKVDYASLHERGLIRKRVAYIKLLGSGKLTKKLHIIVNKASKRAVEEVEKLGGKVELIK